MSPNDSLWQGVLLGLGDDGVTYHCQGDTWQPYIPPLNPQDKAADLTAVTEQRDRLAEALRLIKRGPKDQYKWSLTKAEAIADQALTILKQ